MSFSEEIIQAMYERLLRWRKELPEQYHARVPEDNLIGMARNLNPVVFNIIKEFHGIQNGFEKQLFGERGILVAKHQAEREELIKRHQAEIASLNPKESPATRKMLSKTHEAKLAQLDKEHADAVFKFDAYVVDTFDHLVAEQQSTFRQAAIPGFFLTNAPQEIKVQIFLIKCMMRLADEFGSEQGS